MRLAGETIAEYVKRDPKHALEDYLAIKAAHDALFAELKCYVHDNGVLKTDGGAAMRKIKKKLKTLNGGRATPILEDAGYDILSMARMKIDEDSIKAAIGVTEGNRMLKVLREAGCYDERTIEYFGIKA